MANTLTNRHSWMAQTVADSFEMEEFLIEDWFREPENYGTITDFLRGNGPPKILIYRQSAESNHISDDFVDNNHHQPSLFLTYGDSVKIKQRGVFFYRNAPEGKTVNLSIANDVDITFGEIGASPITSLDNIISSAYVPLINQMDPGDWGECDEEQVQELTQGLKKFSEELTEAIKSMTGGVKLRKPNKEFEFENVKEAAENERAVAHYEKLMQEWINEIENYVEEGNETKWESNDLGPRTELDYWRGRNQRLTSINEQKKSKEVNFVRQVLNQVSKMTSEQQSRSKENIMMLLNQWKSVDIKITEALNEAKDNVKYLTTLEKFIEPLYTGTPQTIIDSLPALMNSVKMIHTIARYYNTTEKMTQLFMKITNQMIKNCKDTILQRQPVDKLWDRNPDQLIETMQGCIRLKEAYQAQYELTREKLQAMPKGKQFDFSKNQIFGKFDLFCRRLTKLIDMFTTVRQFNSLSDHKLENMDDLINDFKKHIEDFKAQRHDLLDYNNINFDRRFVEFNVNISKQEQDLQGFINRSFEKSQNTDDALNLLKKFQSILKRDSLQTELQMKYNLIFSNYGITMDTIKSEYMQWKSGPPLVRNMPTVAGNILWARHLFHRIQEPMERFPDEIKKAREHRPYISLYNRIGQTLTLFEIMFLQAWCNEIERSKAGLQATLIWKTEDTKLHVNFDDEIFQLIREAKCLDRMGVEIPESARIVLLQEDKFKQYYNELDYLLKEYERVLAKIRPITRPLLGPHLEDLEYKLRPGMVTLTWTSMNIEGYLYHVHSGLQKLEQLIISINDIIENRIENNLKSISKVILVKMPEQGKTYSQEQFVDLQQKSARKQTQYLMSKNIEVERAVDDLLATINAYPLDQHIQQINQDEIIKLKKYYNWTMYQALLHCTKNSLNAMKERVCGKKVIGANLPAEQSPFFEVTVNIETETNRVFVTIDPSLDDVQEHINRAAIAVLKCSKSVVNWFQQDIPDNEEKKSFYDIIAMDREIVKVILLLTGSIHGTKNLVGDYLNTFMRYCWLWEEDIEKKLQQFSRKDPSLDDFEEKLKYFASVRKEIEQIEKTNQIGAMALQTDKIKEGLINYVNKWNEAFSRDLHKRARFRLDNVLEYINQTEAKLKKEATGIDTLGNVMATLREIRQKEGEIELEFKPIIDMYSILDYYMDTAMEKDEQDQRHVLRSKWKNLVDQAEQKQNALNQTQNQFKLELIKSVKFLIHDVEEFRKDYESNGPMVQGIVPREANERLRRFKEEYSVRERNFEVNFAAETLFNLPHQPYVKLEQTKKELDLLSQLYDLYNQVLDNVNSWKDMLWSEAVERIDEMKDQVDQFSVQCRRLPRQLKEWDAYIELKKEIDDFVEILPMLKDLSKKSIQPRHWTALKDITGTQFSTGSEDMFYLSKLLEANLLVYKEEIEEIIESADKQMKIEEQLIEIKQQWDNEVFDFDTYRNREYNCRLGGRVNEVQENLEEAQAALTTMNAMKHVTPFKAEVVKYLEVFSDVSETIDLWQRVQVMWQSLEPVFMQGDISRQMPTEARLFQNTDKNWVKIMEKASDTQKVIECCQDDMLKKFLPSIKEALESCQSSLNEYLESKRNKFARFFFQSDAVLLSILSQGSEPTSIQPFLELLFDAIEKVQFDRVDRKLITHMIGGYGGFEEPLELAEPVKAEGNIEDWLKKLEHSMQHTIKEIMRNASRDVTQIPFNEFLVRYCAQADLVGLQVLWTHHVQECLEKAKDRRIADEKKKIMSQLWEILRDLCMSTLNKLERCNIETLVTIHVHQRDVLDEIVQNLGKDTTSKANSANSFDWLKRTRIYWRGSEDTCFISITDQNFEYLWEYLGIKARLVITPLTDRCYITLAQALGMNYGGAPAGPAGTGKTETVKDLGRTLGVFVVVTNCGDQHRYKDMAGIFKGLAQSGLWGCFDEFNRILLEVLSVVAMQVQAITKAKANKDKYCYFPGETYPILLIPTMAYFITMNPGYAGRQNLPENLKVLFRSVAMMVPNRLFIIRTFLASCGYDNYDDLSKKFTVLYALCEEQLSKQRHYDFGLRNIIALLRTAGETKRLQRQANEEMLLMRTLREGNFSKLVKDDVGLFLQLLRDIFPEQADPKATDHGQVEVALRQAIQEEELIDHPAWYVKIIQLYEICKVRHGFMMVGPTGTGKSSIYTVLTKALSQLSVKHNINRLNPKAITADELYGRKIPITDEWMPGVFSTMWQKCNNKNNKNNTWIMCDGPVDTLWIESLNTVLDDNKILTLPNNDRIAMTDNVKLVFEVENLRNASPATVSRCGIVYISEEELGWEPLIRNWARCRTQSQKVTTTGRGEEAEICREIIMKYFQTNNMLVNMFKYGGRIYPAMYQNNAVMVGNFITLLTVLLEHMAESTLQPIQYEKIIIFCIIWTLGSMFDQEERAKFHQYLQSVEAPLPNIDTQGDTIYEYGLDSSKNWSKWQADPWQKSGKVQFASLLIPTMDSTRAEWLMEKIINMPLKHEYRKQLLLIGGAGTAKTSTILMYTSKLLDDKVLKKMNFSSATTPRMFQDGMDQDLEKKNGRNYAPPNNKLMIVFIDDMSMPFVNDWGDQVTLEIVRQIIDQGGYYFLDKDNIGDFKQISNLKFIGAMNHPGAGKNDIPDRLKRLFFGFNMTLPTRDSIDNIYGEIIRAFFTMRMFNNQDVVDTAQKLVNATIVLWDRVKKRFLPTPSQFHYLFNMRELSRVFQGVFEIIKTREGVSVILKAKNIGGLKPQDFLVGLWKHECERVFSDKLTTLENKEEFTMMLKKVTEEQFSPETEAALGDGLLFADFQRKDIYNEDGELEEAAPKVYEAIKSMTAIKKKLDEFLEQYNKQSHGKTMNLVLFDDAIRYLMRISRIIQMDRGSTMLVGVGGSGKQSLTKLAAFIGRHVTHQIMLTKTYNQNALFADLLQLYKWSGHEGKKTTFIMTDAEIKQEYFLEFINSILSTGEVAGLLPKEERDIILADMRQIWTKERPNSEPTNLELYQYFIDRVRSNLHIVLCFSPVGDKFRERFRKFPAVFNGCTINWFLSWPQDALVSVSSQTTNNFNIHCTPEVKSALTEHMGKVHDMVRSVCDIYFAKMRRQVHVTPKSYLSFLSSYRDVYLQKVDEIEVLEERVGLGLSKLKEAEEDVKKNQRILEQEQVKIAEADRKAEAMLADLKVEEAKATAQTEAVGKKKEDCQQKAEEINAEREIANKQLEAALPFLENALKAVDSITPKDINEFKTNKNPVDVIRLIVDGVLILMHQPVIPVKERTLKFRKGNLDFIDDSFDQYGKSMTNNAAFLGRLIEFSNNDKDNINDETCELLEPYLSLEHFNPETARAASGAATGLCVWVGAMVQYHEASKIVKPKMDFLAIQEQRLTVATQALEEAEAELKESQDKLDSLNAFVASELAKKKELEDSANRMKRKTAQANKLISSLSDEKIRWTEDSNNFADTKRRLVGDVAVATAFVSYCGPFNSEFRNMLMKDYFISDLKASNVPVTLNLDLTSFLIEKTIVAEWNLQGLPKDDLSTQNGIMVTRSSRFPLMIDPQGQAVKWIMNMKAENLTVTQLTGKFMEKVRFCLEQGVPLLIENIEHEIDPELDPILEKQIITKGKTKYVNVSGQTYEWDDDFELYMTSRLSNPKFSPELAAKTTIIDFTVTITGLEQQLLGRVLSKKQRSLEESLQNLLEEITNSSKMLEQLNKALLVRLTNTSGSLIDDIELIDALNNTKSKAIEVQQKLLEADEKQKDINEQREVYRPVATRGSLMYFTIVEMCNINWMYNTSLNQFLQQYDDSVDKAEDGNTPQEKAAKIITKLTYTVYRYINRGLFEKDKMTYIMMNCLKILQISGKLQQDDIDILLKSGAGLDLKAEKPNPYSKFMSNDVWLNVIQLSRHPFGKDNLCIFRDLPESIGRATQEWQNWLKADAPENIDVPEFNDRIMAERDIGKFIKLALVRALREDRTTIAAIEFIEFMLGPEFTKPVTDRVEQIWEETNNRVPTLYLLSAGADPTSAIEELGKRKRKHHIEKVSMGEGQEVIAERAIKESFLTGNWVILYNCHLGLDFMSRMEFILGKDVEIEDEFRLWLTCEPRDSFPIGLLQMAIKATMEAPKGVKASLERTFSTVIDNDYLEKHDSDKWRKYSYVVCFMHSVVIERRKFGPLGWCIPYEFNVSDLEASLHFIDQHMTQAETLNTPISVDTIRFMVTEIQYGGRITDAMDFRLIQSFGYEWIEDKITMGNFCFGDQPQYKVLDFMDIEKYRQSIRDLPNFEVPRLFFLNNNADITYRKREANELLLTIQLTQPKQSDVSGGKSRDDIINEKVLENLQKLPNDFIEPDVREQIRTLQGARGTGDKGFGAPLNNFLFQEIMRFQNILSITRDTLNKLIEVHAGNIILTPELQEAGDCIYDSRTPKAWLYDMGLNEISWIINNLGGWFTGLQERYNQLNNWLRDGRPNIFILGFFFNPTGFLTAVKQEITRLHKNENWALDRVTENTEVTNDFSERPRNTLSEGQYIRGLFLEGARINIQENCKLDELQDKDTFVPMPNVKVGAQLKDITTKGGKDYEDYQHYRCPCYKYPERNDKYYIFEIKLRSEGSQNQNIWRLRGIAVLCSPP